MAGFDFTPTGSMTLESEAGAVKREADESYKLTPESLRPDLAIEVIFTSGGIDKLEAYKRLAISEVWFWGRWSTGDVSPAGGGGLIAV